MATELIQEISTSATRAQSEMRALLLQLRPAYSAKRNIISSVAISCNRDREQADDKMHYAN